MTPTDPAPARRAALGFIFVTALLDMLAYGIVIPVLPQLVTQLLGGDLVSGARAYGWFGTAWAGMQFLCSPVLGMLSDRFGRRPVILISCFGLAADFLIMAVAPTVGWLLLGRTLAGMTSANFSTASAYLADITPPEKRAQAFGMFGAVFGAGFILGPVIGGWLGHVSPRLPFWFASTLALANGCYGYFVLPESLPPAKRSARLNWRRANPVGALQLLRSHHELLGLSLTNWLCQLAHFVLPSTMVLYATYRYHWGAHQVGNMMALTGAASILVQMVLVKPAIARFGERRTMLIGLAFGCLGFLGYALARSGLQFLIAVPVFGLMGLFGPGLQALLTRRVPANEQGQLQGATSCTMGIAGLIAPGMFTHTFAHFIEAQRLRPLPGAPMYLAAALMAIALLLGTRVTRRTAEAVGEA